MTNRLKSVGSALLSILPLGLFIVGCVWVLLFPAISVTTGELKPRGMYVDEHALLVHSQLFKNPVLVPVSYINATRGLEMCDKLDNPLISCSILKNLSVSSAGTVNISHNTDITQIILRPYRSKIIYESTVLMFHYIPGVDCMEELVVRLVSSIQKHLHSAEWMARNIVILVVPSQHPDQLDAWLRQTHAPSAQQLQDLAYALVDGSKAAAYVGTIREAYVLDLTQEKACHPDSSQYAFSSLTLLHDGLNGILPNMDMVSFPLAIHNSGVLRTHSEVCSVQLNSDISAALVRLLKAYPQSGLVNMWVAFAASLWAEMNSTPALRLYRARLLGLACSMHAQISPALPNQQALFLKYNIDAITLRPVALSVGKRLTPQHQNQQRGSRSRGGRAGPPQEEQQVFGPEKLLEALLSLLYVSNNLHEELHHSHFYYLLMGSDSFVGIGEYGFTAVAFLLALLALFHQLCGLCGEDLYLNAVYCVTAVTLPILVALSALTQPSASSTLSPIWTPVQQHITSAVQAYAPEGWQPYAALTLGYVAGLGTLLLWYSSCRKPHDAGKIGVAEASTGATVSSQGSTEELLPTLSVLVLSLLLSLSWLFTQNFSLAVVLAISILPTLLWGSLAVRRRGDAARVTVRRLGLAGLLALSAALHSPPGLYALDRAFTAVLSVSGTSRSVLLDVLLEAWCQRGVLAFPACLLLHTLASYYSVSCAHLLLCGARLPAAAHTG